MKNKQNVITIALICVSIPLVFGCATFPKENVPNQRSNLTMGTVKKEVRKGVTTQAEIIQLFGSPNLVTKNRANDEIWNYNKMSYQAMSGADGGSLIFWGGSRAMTSTTTKSFDLIITFDENDIVKDYSVISTSY